MSRAFKDVEGVVEAVDGVLTWFGVLRVFRAHES